MWELDGVLRYVPIAALHDGRLRWRNCESLKNGGKLGERPGSSPTARPAGVEWFIRQGRELLNVVKSPLDCATCYLGQ